MSKKLPPFRLRFRSHAETEKMCVFRLWSGKRYFIWKGKSFPDAAHNMSCTIDRLLRKPDGPGRDIVAYLMDEIESSRPLYLEVEPVCFPDTPFELLVKEWQMLQVAMGDPNCLNSSFVPHVPKWIPEEDVAKYNDHLKTQGNGKSN